MTSHQDVSTDHVVLVIHGVGDPQPGDTLSLFARSIAHFDQPLVERQEVIWLNEKCESGIQVQTFGAHLRHLSFGRENACLSEVFWGDLSRVRRGLVGAGLGLIEILFGIRYVAYVAANQTGAAAMALKRLGLLATNVLHGPVLAITFFLALMTITLAGTELTWTNSFRAEFWARILMFGCCGVASGAAELGQKLTRNSGIRSFWFWVQILSVYMLGLVLVKIFWLDSRLPGLLATDQIKPGLIWYCDVLVMFLGLLWLAEMLIVMAMGICWITAVIRPGVHRPGLHVAFLLPAMAVGFWGFALPVAWLAAAKFLRKFVQLSEFEKLFNEAVPLLGVQCIMAVFVTVAAGLVLLRYATWRSRILRQTAAGNIEPPRLIVHGGLQLMIAGCTVLGVTGVASISLLLLQDFQIEQIWGGEFLVNANRYATAILMPLGLFFFMVFPHLRPVLDIVLDVINHFFFRPTRVEDMLDGDEFDIRETTLEKGRLFFARRDAIHLRIKRILAYFRDHLATRPTLTIISHSQGTMVGIEVLNDPELAWLNSTFGHVRLVTMGSPFRHLYQHYFRHLYPDLSQDHWRHLRTRLDRWINIYRQDDFVGTRLIFPTPRSSVAAETFSPASVSLLSPQPAGGDSVERCVYSNHPVGLRGHMNYWTDKQVLEILQRELLSGQPIQAASAPGTRRAA